jgi:hypothetical protein
MAAASASFAMTLVVFVALLFVPSYGREITTSESSSQGNFTSKTVEDNQTLLQVNGPRVLLYLAGLVVIAGLPLLFRRSRWRAVLEASTATLMTAFTIIAGFSIGLFYLPSALAMLIAALLACPARTST